MVNLLEKSRRPRDYDRGNPPVGLPLRAQLLRIRTRLRGCLQVVCSDQDVERFIQTIQNGCSTGAKRRRKNLCDRCFPLPFAFATAPAARRRCEALDSPQISKGVQEMKPKATVMALQGVARAQAGKDRTVRPYASSAVRRLYGDHAWFPATVADAPDAADVSGAGWMYRKLAREGEALAEFGEALRVTRRQLPPSRRA